MARSPPLASRGNGSLAGGGVWFLRFGTLLAECRSGFVAGKDFSRKGLLTLLATAAL
jgi:hypothetical protein